MNERQVSIRWLVYELWKMNLSSHLLQGKGEFQAPHWLRIILESSYLIIHMSLITINN